MHFINKMINYLVSKKDNKCNIKINIKKNIKYTRLYKTSLNYRLRNRKVKFYEDILKNKNVISKMTNEEINDMIIYQSVLLVEQDANAYYSKSIISNVLHSLILANKK